MNSLNPLLQNLSYSAINILHECPRKFELNRLQAKPDYLEESEERIQTLTFSFGHTVGQGVQLLLEGKSIEQTYWELFISFKGSLLFIDEKRNKSFAHALHAIDIFNNLLSSNLILEDYQIVSITTQQGITKFSSELGFRISYPNGYKFRGYIDVILIHKITGEILVLEIKTSSQYAINPNIYRNSPQATGYAVVIDHLFKDVSSYNVLYGIYKTKSMEWEFYSFPKSMTTRAKWLQNILIDTKKIELYHAMDSFPMYGESCVGKYFRECEYINSCHLDNSILVGTSDVYVDFDSDGNVIEHKPSEKEKDKLYDFEFTLDDMINKFLEN